MRNQGSNGYPIDPELFIEKTIFTSLKCNSAFVLNQETDYMSVLPFPNLLTFYLDILFYVFVSSPRDLNM